MVYLFVENKGYINLDLSTGIPVSLVSEKIEATPFNSSQDAMTTLNDYRDYLLRTTMDYNNKDDMLSLLDNANTIMCLH